MKRKETNSDSSKKILWAGKVSKANFLPQQDGMTVDDFAQVAHLFHLESLRSQGLN